MLGSRYAFITNKQYYSLFKECKESSEEESSYLECGPVKAEALQGIRGS